MPEVLFLLRMNKKRSRSLPHPLFNNKMMSQTFCTVSGASIPLTQLHLPHLFKPNQTFLERNGSYNSKANTKHSYETIKTTSKMSDQTETTEPMPPSHETIHP